MYKIQKTAKLNLKQSIIQSFISPLRNPFYHFFSSPTKNIAFFQLQKKICRQITNCDIIACVTYPASTNVTSSLIIVLHLLLVFFWGRVFRHRFDEVQAKFMQFFYFSSFFYSFSDSAHDYESDSQTHSNYHQYRINNAVIFSVANNWHETQVEDHTKHEVY